MGISKAMMERLARAFVRNHPPSQTVVSTTRYGDVVSPRGSVIALFVDKVCSSWRLTVTDPNMTRFLVSFGESVVLVQYAFANAYPGDVFMRNAPDSTVADLAPAK